MKRIISITVSMFLIISLLFSIPAYAVERVPIGYKGIYNVENLNAIRNDLDGKYILMNDIDLSSYINWEPIGNAKNPFTGEFNGNGYSINNFTVKIDSENGDEILNTSVGVFGLLKDATVVNLNVLNVNISINHENAFFSIGTIADTIYNSQVHCCSSSGNINLTTYNFDASHIGGIVGFISENSILSNCINETNINLIQLKKEEPDDDFSFVTPGIARSSIGGISAGGFRATLSDCINKGTITAEMIGSGSFGGIVGAFDDRLISDCGNIGDISINKSNGNCGEVGGICGSSYSVTNCFNAGSITTTSPNAKIGAISGKATDNAVFTNCYYNNQMDYAVSNPEDCVFNNVKGVGAEEMKKQSTFEGFDFENVWTIPDGETPMLRKVEYELDVETSYINFYLEQIKSFFESIISRIVDFFANLKI